MAYGVDFIDNDLAFLDTIKAIFSWHNDYDLAAITVIFDSLLLF